MIISLSLPLPLNNIKKMSTTCAADQHKFFPSHQLSSSSSFYSKKNFKDFLEIPPRKLLSKKIIQENPDISSYESNLHKFLPSNNGGDNSHEDDDDLDPYSSDHFRMYEFKVRRCTRSRSHDWTDCPFAHPGEKARRRDPRKYHYSGAVCPEFRRGGCSRGDSCEFAHGVFECWLHPSRYRTEACKDGRNCKRKVCFFAHSPHQIRILPEISSNSNSPNSPNCNSFITTGHGGVGGGCCLACHSVISSPTSTLLGMSHMSPPLSPSLSPPLSPAFSRLSKLRCGLMSYKDVINELMNSLEAMNFHEIGNNNRNFNSNSWIDSSCSFNGDDHQQQFVLSPSTPSPNSANFFSGDCSRKGFLDEEIRVGDHNNNNSNGDYSSLASLDPDLGWVNELLK